jgi:dihydrofolate reductase
MAKLIYFAISSLDGYIEDADGKFDWAEPDEEVHAFLNELVRPVGTYLLGRRMYETLVFWERPPDLAAQPPVVQDFAEIWQSAEKIVYSSTLQTASSAKTRIEREFDPEAVRHLRHVRAVTSRSVVPSLRPRRSRPGLSTSTTCCSCLSSSEAVSALPRSCR